MQSQLTRKRRLVRVVTGGTVLVLTMGGLAACSSTDDSAGGGGDTLSIVWESGGKAALDVMIEKFEAANPGTSIEPEYLDAGAIKTQIPTRLAAGTAPDVFRTEAGRGTTIAVQYLADKDYLAEITGENTKSVPEFVSGTLSLDGTTYGYTPVLAAVGQVFNDQALAASGLAVPTTWDEVLQFCADARAKGTIAYANGPVTPHENQTIPYALSGELVFGADPDLDAEMADGSKTFEDSGWGDAIEREKEMVDAGCFADSFTGNDMNSVIDSLATGSTLGMVGYSAYLPYVQSDSTYSLYTLPGSDDPASSKLLVAPFASFGINSKAKNGELAQKFVDFVASPEMSLLYAQTVSPGGGLLTSSYQQQPEAPADPIGQTMVEYLDAGNTIQFPDSAWPNPQVQVALQSGVQEFIQGNQSVDDVLSAMQTAYDLGSDK